MWLIIRPVFDEVTEITFNEAQDVIDYFTEKGVAYIDLAKEDAVREKVEKVLKETPDINVHHADHGSEDKIWGNDDRPVIDLENVELLRGRAIHNNNCSSAKKLGVEAWKRGCLAFWGYTEVVYFTTDALEEFKEAMNYGLKRRVDGFSWSDCLKKTKERMTELIDALVKAGKALAASCLRHDRDSLVCYNSQPPAEPSCPVRRLSVKVFGANIGWKLTRKFGIAILLFGMGFGIALGKLTHTFWEIGGLQEVFAPQGDYVGYALMLIAFLTLIIDHTEGLRKR